MSDKERLEQIKDAIAHELGLTDDYMDGTYLYYLTRCKSAFAVGTMTLDDFKEIDEELLDEIFNAIEPFFIEQAERVQVLESELNKQIEIGYKFEGEVYDLAKENKRYREALNTIITLWIASTDATDDTWLAHEMSETARQALEGEE